MIQYVFVYFVLLIFIWISSKYSLWEPYRNNKIGVCLCLTLLCAMSAFKSSTIGNDTHEYIRIFKLGEDVFKAETRYELGYLLFSQIIWKLFHNIQALFIVYSLLFYFSLGRFLFKYSSMPWISIFMFFAYTLFGFSMSALRQSLAIAILFWGFDFALQRKYVSFAFTIICASMFHVSAIFFSLCPLILRLKPTRRTLYLIVMFIIFGLVMFSNIQELFFKYLPYFGHYQNGAYYQGGVRLASIFQLLLSMLFLYISYSAYKGILEDECSFEKLFLGKLIIIQLVVVALSILCLKVNILDRVVLYYSSFVMLLVPNSIALMPYEKRNFWGLMSLTSVFIYTLIILMFRPEWNSVFPYSFCWNE